MIFLMKRLFHTFLHKPFFFLSLLASLFLLKIYGCFFNITREVLLVIWGSYALFKTNAAGDNKDFFQRYVALSFVMFLRVFIFFLLFTFMSGVIYEVMFAKFFVSFLASQDPSFQNIIADVMFTCISWFATWSYYMLLKNSFKRVAYNKKSSSKEIILFANQYLGSCLTIKRAFQFLRLETSLTNLWLCCCIVVLDCLFQTTRHTLLLDQYLQTNKNK